jgi:hypothetical protein
LRRNSTLELVLVLDSLKADEIFIFAHTNNSLGASGFREVRSSGEGATPLHLAPELK